VDGDGGCETVSGVVESVSGFGGHGGVEIVGGNGGWHQRRWWC